MKKFKKIMSVILVMIMMFSVLPAGSINAAGIKSIQLDTVYDMTDFGEYETMEFVPQKDGWYVFCAVGNVDWFVDAYLYTEDEELYYDYLDLGEEYLLALTYKLTAGTTYYLETMIDKYTTTSDDKLEFYVAESVGVESVEITQQPYNTTVIKGYEYESYDLSGLEAEFTLSDGSTEKWRYEDDNLVSGFSVYTYDDIDEDGNFYVTIWCGMVETQVYFTSVESDVDYIEYNCDTDIVLYENTGGLEYDGMYYYFYEIPENATVTVYYKDGISVTAGIDDSVNDIYFDYFDTQEEKEWTVNGDNYIYVYYMDFETTIPVEVLATPIKSVTVNTAPAKEYVLGDFEYSYELDGVYVMYPLDLTGINFTVEYNDGSKKTYTDADIDMENGTIDGGAFDIFEIEAKKAGTYKATLRYMGYDITYNVKVINSPVKNIEILSEPTITEYETEFYPIFDGMKIKINFNDGTSKTVEITDENVDYYAVFLGVYEVTDGDLTFYIQYEYDEDYNEYYVIKYLGKEAEYKGFSFVEGKDVKNVAIDNMTTVDGDGMVATVEYRDGTKDVLTCELVATMDYGMYDYECYAKTEKGLVFYGVELDVAQDGTVVGYYVNFFGEDIYVEATQPENPLLGDVDNDSVISVMDATAIQLHIAKKKPLDDAQMNVADVDHDGEVSVMDATAIQMYVAKKITEF